MASLPAGSSAEERRQSDEAEAELKRLAAIRRQAYESEQATIAREAEDLREAFEERSAILQHDAGLEHAEAELESARITGTLARNRGYLWASLRSALSDYPSLLAQVPNRAGPVDALAWVYPRSPC